MDHINIVELLRQRGIAVAVAESITGGSIAARIVQHAGASHVLKLGVVAYCDEMKRDVLGVPQSLLDAHTAVSAQVACAMADGVRRLSHGDVAVATTGYADGEHAGTVYIGYADARGTSAQLHHFDGTRGEVIDRAADTAIHILLERTNPA